MPPFLFNLRDIDEPPSVYRTHLYKAVEVMKTCCELESIVKPMGNLPLEVFAAIHNAAQYSLFGIVKDAKNPSLFQGFVDAVTMRLGGIDGGRCRLFEERWRDAQVKDTEKEKIFRSVSKKLRDTELGPYDSSVSFCYAEHRGRK
ncbi:hypothetical protein PM082_016229 [Marasmius tenuissimus]|nr:hypothetical protein PM082_016229 [Marasmius tenuissimus]